MKKLKPVTFVRSMYGYNVQNTSQQIMLLKAMTVTDDPKKLRRMIGVKSVAEVYRTLDKITLRKEYHGALEKLGIDFEFIAKGIKGICDDSEDESVRLKGYQTLLKSLGVDSYKDDEGMGSSNWEETLLKSLENDKIEKKIVDVKYNDYEVIVPQIPESVKRQKEIEQETGKGLYE